VPFQTCSPEGERYSDGRIGRFARAASTSVVSEGIGWRASAARRRVQRLLCRSALSMQGVRNGLRVSFGNPQECQGWTIRRTPSLLPIPKRGDTDTNHERELAL